MKKKRERVLVLCAHPDDEIIAMGGTIARYKKEGKKVRVIIFSSGEKIIPWLKEGLVKRKRIKESEIVSKILGCKVEFLGFPDLRLLEDLEVKARKVGKIIKEFRPDKIFTHNRYDAHPDHRAVSYMVEKTLKSRKRKPKVLTFLVWSLFNPKDAAKVYINIDDFFAGKIKALNAFKTQKLVMAIFYLPVYIKAKWAGYRNSCKFAEVFYTE